LSATPSEVTTGNAAGEAGAVDHSDVEDCAREDDVLDADDEAVDGFDDGCGDADGTTAVVSPVTVTVSGAERALSGPSTVKVASSSV
jgi:hypothetical protein